MAQNVTVSLPNELVREAKHLAVDEGLSLSRFVSRVLEDHLEKVRLYRAARERQSQVLKAGLRLDTKGHISWQRGELHER